MSRDSDTSYELAAHAAEAMLDRKARDVTIMDMRDAAGFVDYFVIGTGDSGLQVKAVVEKIRERLLQECGEKPWHMEGADTWEWVLLDYVHIAAHVFSPEKRAFYDLERLWGDAPRERIEEAGVGSGGLSSGEVSSGGLGTKGNAE